MSIVTGPNTSTGETSEMSSINGKVGPLAYAANGSSVTLARYGHFGEQIVGQAGGPYDEAVDQGQMWTGGNQAARALSALLNTTCTGLILYNPAGSFTRAYVEKVGISVNAVGSAASSFVLMGGWASAGVATHTTAVGITLYGNCLIGSNSSGASGSKCGLDEAATLVGIPRILMNFGSLPITTQGSYSGDIFDIGGSIAIDPGGWIAIGGTVAVTAAVLGSFTWRERTIPAS